MIRTDLAEIITSFAKALDLSSNGIAYHHQTVALIALAIAEQLEIPGHDRDTIFLSALVHDAGIRTQGEVGGLLVFEDKNPFNHCKQGYEIFSPSTLLHSLAHIILHHHDRWKGPNPSGLTGNEIPIASNIIYLADRVSALMHREEFVLNRSHEIVKTIVQSVGTMFNPLAVDAFVEVAKKDSFWLDVQTEFIVESITRKKPRQMVTLSVQELTELVSCFSRVIDSKSPYTHMHSVTVASVAGFLARKLGFSEYEQAMIKVAGYLHDVGKIAIPDSILNKPDKLTDQEYSIMKKHAYYSYALLQNIPGLELVLAWGPTHHEKLDGSGYPRRLKGGEISLGARIMAVSDIFTALIEDRPYRAGLNKEGCLAIMKELGDSNHLDQLIINLVEQYYGSLLMIKEQIFPITAAAQCGYPKF